MRASAAPTAQPDDRTAACRTVAIMVAANKPLYPLMLLTLIGGDAAWRSLPTLASAPLFAAIPFLARRCGFWARVALPVVGTADTAFATTVMGANTGAELFFAACGLLAVVSFWPGEQSSARLLVALIYGAFAAVHALAGPALPPWPPGEAAQLLTINAFSAASLCAFVALRFSFADANRVL